MSWKSWKYHGNLTEVSWKHHENIMDKSWNSRSKITAVVSRNLVISCHHREMFYSDVILDGENLLSQTVAPHKVSLNKALPWTNGKDGSKASPQASELLVNRMNFDGEFEDGERWWCICTYLKTNLDLVLRKWEMFAAIWEFQRTWDGMMRFDSNNSPSMHVNPLKKVSLPHKDQNQRKTPTSINFYHDISYVAYKISFPN